MTKATFYVQFVPEIAYGTVRGIRTMRLTRKPPESIAGARVAVVKFVATLPDEAFDPFLAEVNVGASEVEIITEAQEPEGAEEPEAVPA